MGKTWPRPITRSRAAAIIAERRAPSLERLQRETMAAATAELEARYDGERIYLRLGLFGVDQLRRHYGPGAADPAESRPRGRKLLVDLITRTTKIILGDRRHRRRPRLPDRHVALIVLAAGWLPDRLEVTATPEEAIQEERRTVRRERERQEEALALRQHRAREFERTRARKQRRAKRK